MAVFEVLEMSPAIEKIILDDPVDSRIWSAARSQGMLTMQEDARQKAFDKLVPYSEVATLSTLLQAEDGIVETEEPKGVPPPDVKPATAAL